ncbi:uncharacterized protein E0L32_011104 [Thyridium curvatum]|uniref:Family c-likeg-protein-coupled receptor protein n=1 Tax=Thyridium curvatum TaxID=1093900 RepID=A0A507AQ33_9PEZI|nr:uncharacterized protein E0L32_011104 [Thyridium curvatum]TPX06959.1 hypothetical protein E0L32_011104 [Thyridium curvatum]
MSGAPSPPGGGVTAPNGQAMPPGPPYFPTIPQVGGIPTVGVDVPISAVLLALFVCSAAVNMTIFQVNRRRDHKFVFSALLFGFSMARIVTLVMRIVWACRPANVRVAIAASIFVAAGVLLLFIVNLVFAQRVVRAYHPRLGWHAALRLVFRLLYACVAALLVMVITATVITFYTLNPNTRRICRDIQLFAGTFLAFLAFLPIPVVLLAALTPRRGGRPVDKFGQGRMRTKVALILFTASLLTLGAGFRIGTSYDLRLRPAWFHHRACFYCFNFVIELVVVFTYTATRFDRRFHVPDGSSGPGDYTARAAAAAAAGGAGAAGGLQRRKSFADRVNTEADVFGVDADDVAPPPEDREREWEERARKELRSQGDDTV